MMITLPGTIDINALTEHFLTFFEQPQLFAIIKTVSYIVIGIFMTLYVCRLVGNTSEKHISAHHSQLLRRLTFYIGLILSFVFPLKISGIDVTAVLSAAGIAAGIITAAIAFASQTSISNFLSGVFLIAEKPFEVGDYVVVNGTFGEILSIDLLSVKLRTKDNIFVRIPNELLLKSQFDNVTRFPIRRFDMKIRVAFAEDLPRVRKILLNTAKQNALCLTAPAPEFNIVEFGDASVVIKFSVWGKQSSFTTLETNIQMEIQAAFQTHDVKLPPSTTVIAVTSS
jgi:small-conductance mechanosensitive channel